MKHINTAGKHAFFKPLFESGQVPSAMMALKPGESSSDEVENEHPKAEQWLFVISGSATARIGDRSIKLKAGSLLLIEKGERHRITATGNQPLVTVNFYSPPAYTVQGEVKPSVTHSRKNAVSE